MLDTNPEHASLQPDNAIIMKPWDGSKGDRGLVEMIPFLECEWERASRQAWPYWVRVQTLGLA